MSDQANQVQQSQQGRSPEVQQVIDDLLFVIVKQRGRYPSDRKSVQALARLQPSGPWQKQLDFMEHERLQGIAAKIAAKRHTADELADYKDNADDNAATIAAHRKAEEDAKAPVKGGA